MFKAGEGDSTPPHSRIPNPTEKQTQQAPSLSIERGAKCLSLSFFVSHGECYGYRVAAIDSDLYRTLGLNFISPILRSVMVFKYCCTASSVCVISLVNHITY